MSGALGLGANGTCSSDGTPMESFANIPFTITLPLVADTTAPRVGYTMIDSANLAVNVGITASDLEVCFNCDIAGIINLSSECDSIVNGLIGIVFPLLSSPLESGIKKVVQGELCTKPGTDGLCPAGSSLDMSRSRRGGDAGMSLLELVVACAILLILATASIPIARNTIRWKKEEELRWQLRQLRDAIDRYKDASDKGQIQVKAGTEGYPEVWRLW